METPENYWSKCTVNPSTISSTLYKIYKDKIRYNEEKSIWEYYDKEWIEDKNKKMLKQYFISESRLDIVNYIEKLEDEIDINRLANVSKYLSTHFNIIIREAKEIFCS